MAFGIRFCLWINKCPAASLDLHSKADVALRDEFEHHW